MKSKPYLLFSILCLLGGMLFSCENNIEKVYLVTQDDDGPVEIGKDVELYYSDSSIVKFKLNAPLLERYDGEDPYTEFLNGFEVLFYNKLKKVESTITADYGINHDKEDKLVAKKNVVVVNKKGETLNTEHLWWEKKNRKIFSNEFVKITTKDEIIYGDGLEANEDFTQYKIKNIKGIITQEESDEEVQ